MVPGWMEHPTLPSDRFRYQQTSTQRRQEPIAQFVALWEATADPLVPVTPRFRWQ